MSFWHWCLPLHDETKILSDLAENITVHSLDFSKIFLLQTKSFYRTVQNLPYKMCFSFYVNISDSALLTFLLRTCFESLALGSRDFFY
jgi:hypothetical protein